MCNQLLLFQQNLFYMKSVNYRSIVYATTIDVSYTQAIPRCKLFAQQSIFSRNVLLGTLSFLRFRQQIQIKS